MKLHLKLAIVVLLGTFALIVPFIFQGYCGEKNVKSNDISQTVKPLSPGEQPPQFNPKPSRRGSTNRNWLRQLTPNRQSNNLLAETELRQEAKLITVKVLSGMSSGSGIIWQKQGEVYEILTNHHVLILDKLINLIKFKLLMAKFIRLTWLKRLTLKSRI